MLLLATRRSFLAPPTSSALPLLLPPLSFAAPPVAFSGTLPSEFYFRPPLLARFLPSRRLRHSTLLKMLAAPPGRLP